MTEFHVTTETDTVGVQYGPYEADTLREAWRLLRTDIRGEINLGRLDGNAAVTWEECDNRAGEVTVTDDDGVATTFVVREAA